MDTSQSAPRLTTEESDNNLRSSPITASFATDKPPSVCNEPSVVLVASVVSSVLSIPPTVVVPSTVKLLESVTRPLELIDIASLSDAEPIVPSFAIITF